MGEWVERRWQGNPSGQVKRERESGVYRAWSPDLLSKLDKRLTKTTYDALVDANDSLRQAQLSVRSHGFESLARLLLRSESLASSYIEGLAVGSRRLLSTEFDNDDRDHVAREILGNIEAVEGAVELASKAAAISKAGLLAVHVQLMSRSPNPDWGGVVRTSQTLILQGAISGRWCCATRSLRMVATVAGAPEGANGVGLRRCAEGRKR